MINPQKRKKEVKTENGRNFPAVTADVVVVNIHAMPLRETGFIVNTVLIRRKDEPFQGMWALPGGFIEDNETIEACANRELFEETGIKNRMLFPIGTFSAPGRDPRGQTISLAFSTVIPTLHTALKIKAGDDAGEVKLFAVKGRAYIKNDLDEEGNVVDQDHVSVTLRDPVDGIKIQYVAKFHLDGACHKVAEVEYSSESNAQLAFDHAEIIALAVASHSSVFNPKRNEVERAPEILEQDKNRIITPADKI